MPSCFLRPCIHPGCRKYAVKGESYCENHLKLVKSARERFRLSAYQRGYDSRWAKARKAYLTAHPLCVECLKSGTITPATDVDHIIPHKGDKTLFWDEKNWQALCHECHSRKTASEDGGFGNGRKAT